MQSLDILVSCFPPIQRKRETKGNQTGNGWKRKAPSLCKTGNGQKAKQGNEGPIFRQSRFHKTRITRANDRRLVRPCNLPITAGDKATVSGF